jgi:hypothetical protein
MISSPQRSPKKSHNKSVSFAGLDYNSPISDMKMSKKDMTVLKNMSAEERSTMQD